MLNDPIVIVGAARTPMGAMQGDFAALSASDLGAVAIKAAVERAGLRPDDVQEAIMGNVLPADSADARICSYECTFCATCADAMGGRCPNCGGELVPRPRRKTGT